MSATYVASGLRSSGTAAPPGAARPAPDADRGADAARVGVHEEVRPGELLFEEAVDLGADRRRRSRAARREVLDRVELQARIAPPDDADPRVLVDVEEEELDGIVVAAAQLDPHLDVEEAALLVERADLVGEVPGRAVGLGVEAQRRREHVAVVVLVAVEARHEERARRRCARAA